MPTEQGFFNFVVAALGAGGGWWVKVLWERLAALERGERSLIDRVAAIDLLVAGSYARREEVGRAVSELSAGIFRRLDRIEDKLDHKADKEPK